MVTRLTTYGVHGINEGNIMFKIGERVRTNDNIYNKEDYGGIEGIIISFGAGSAVVEVTNEGTKQCPRGSKVLLRVIKYTSIEIEVPTPETYNID